MRQRKSTLTKEEFINPFKKKEIKYWADQWQVQMQIIKDAMGVTGSARVNTIKNFLRKLNYIPLSKV